MNTAVSSDAAIDAAMSPARARQARGEAGAAFLGRPFRDVFAGRIAKIGWLSSLTLLSMVLSLIPAVAFGLTIDKVIHSHSLRNLLLITLALFVGHTVEVAIGIATERLTSTLRRGASERLQAEVMDCFEHAPLMALEQKTASLVLRRVRSIDGIVLFYIDWYRSLMVVPLFMLGISGFVLAENGILGVSMIALTVLYVYAYWRMNHKLKAQYRLESHERDVAARRMSEFLHGLITLRMAGKIGAFRRGLRQQQESARGLREQRIRRISTLKQLSSGYTRLAIIVLLTVGSWLVFRHSLSIGHLVAINLIFRRVLSEARAAVPLIQRFYQTGHDIDLVRTLLDDLRHPGQDDALTPDTEHPVAPGSAHDAVPEVPHFERIVVRDLTFRYPGGQTDILRAVDFSLRAGEVVAVVGGSGAGKTSLLKLLCGLYAPSAGTISFVGGEAGRRVRYSVATPVDVLFNRSVRDNITLGNASDDEQVREAARIALADDFISSLEHAYETELHDQGRNLSQGQKQRLNLARCFVNDAQLVLLDEPTSALDKLSEASLIENLVRLKNHKTIVMVTHRLAPALAADTIVMLERGEVVEWGATAQLLVDPDSTFRRWVTDVRRGETVVDA